MGASFLLVLLGFIAAWTPLFFGLHRPDLGFLDIMPVWLTIIATIARFCPINGGATLLLLPYRAWGIKTETRRSSPLTKLVDTVIEKSGSILACIW
jgi:tryptophan-rich sensory protein